MQLETRITRKYPIPRFVKRQQIAFSIIPITYAYAIDWFSTEFRDLGIGIPMRNKAEFEQ